MLHQNECDMSRKKSFYRYLSVLLFGILTQATSCEEDYPDQSYIMSENNVPQEPYLTTISTAYFHANIVGHGWKWKESWQIDEKGVGMRYDASNLSDYIPNDLYFGADSMTVFMYKETSNERRTGSYIYDATNNCILSQAIDYMQMTDADSFSISFIERHGDRYYKSNYERMLPYELNARWNGSKPEKP